MARRIGGVCRRTTFVVSARPLPTVAIARRHSRLIGTVFSHKPTALQLCLHRGQEFFASFCKVALDRLELAEDGGGGITAAQQLVVIRPYQRASSFCDLKLSIQRSRHFTLGARQRWFHLFRLNSANWAQGKSLALRAFVRSQGVLSS